MVSNIYLLCKIVIFICFKGYAIENYYLFYKFYFANFNVITYIYKELNQIDDGKSYIHCKYNKCSRNSYKGVVYVVKPGDTLYYIAWITGNNYLDLAKKNNIKNINLLEVNQVLKIKSSNTKYFFCKIFPKKILLLFYKVNYKINKLFFFLKKNNLFIQSDRNEFDTANLIDNNCFSKSESNSRIFNNWHWPTNGFVVNTFSDTEEGGNKGIDISGVFDQPVVAATSGQVVYVGNILKGYGNLVVIKHGNHYLSAYAHNNKVLVIEQQQVNTGDQIATMGDSGTNEVKLHFEIRYKGQSVNPLHLLP